jgi:hypothetical protein
VQVEEINPASVDDDLFGASIAKDDNTIVIGAPAESGNVTGVGGDPLLNDLQESSAAFVYVKAMDGSWVLDAYFKTSNPDIEDHFDQAVAINGDTIVIGAPREDSATGSGDPSDNSVSDAGAVYVYVREGGT